MVVVEQTRDIYVRWCVSVGGVDLKVLFLKETVESWYLKRFELSTSTKNIIIPSIPPSPNSHPPHYHTNHTNHTNHSLSSPSTATKMPPPPPTTEPPTAPRTRPLTQQIQIIRELWLLREQARVQAAERRFLTELERLLSGTHVTSPRPPAPHQTTSPHAAAAPPPPPPPLPDDLRPASLPSQPLFAPGPVRERLRAFEGEVQQLREQQHVTVRLFHICFLYVAICIKITHQD